MYEQNTVEIEVLFLWKYCYTLLTCVGPFCRVSSVDPPGDGRGQGMAGAKGAFSKTGSNETSKSGEKYLYFELRVSQNGDKLRVSLLH